MTGNQLIDSVVDELEEVDYKSTGTKASVSQERLNDTLRDMLNRHPFTWRVEPTPIPITVVVDMVTYNAQSSGYVIQDFIAIILDTGDMNTFQMGEITPKEYFEKYADVEYAAADYPREYTKVGLNGFRVGPRPKTQPAIPWVFRVYYIPEFKTITDFTADLWFPNRALETIKLGLNARLYKVLREFDKATYNYTLYESSLKVLITEDKTNPNLEFHFRGMSGEQGVYSGEYWKNPFIRRVR